MASGRRFNTLGLCMNTNVRRQDSTAFLVSPELSASPQFSMSPTYSYAQCNDFLQCGSRSLQKSMQNNSWQENSVGSSAPLLPSRKPSVGTMDLKKGSLSRSKFMYGMFVGKYLRLSKQDSVGKFYMMVVM